MIERLPVYGVRAFAGKIDQVLLDWSESWTLALRYDGIQAASNYAGDYRDWDDIRAWAIQVGQELKGLTVHR